ncbi:cystathionine beta-lyase [Salinarimonas sp. NSM]|uniref:cystathionine beta-lyase n=1 Tax=Salinarimonas sp. NSM TaxID=3458003 RepID=UPI0040371773
MQMTEENARSSWRAATRLVHAGRDPSTQHGFVNTPIYRGSTVLFSSMDDLVNRRGRYVYGTRGTPTTEALEHAWTELSGAAGTVLAPSGLGAISLALLSLVKAGDHVLVTDNVYWPTRAFCDEMLSGLGVEITYFEPMIGAGIAALIRPNTRVLFLETPGSLTLEVQDVPTMAAAAREKGVSVVIDNTWATPLLYPPHARGADLAIEAGTKYLSGGSDLLLGMVSANAEHWPRLRKTFDLFSNCAGPEDVFLALRGMRSMSLRLEEAERQGLAMAHWLSARPEVRRVLHPAMPEHTGHEIWKRDFHGSSGLFSVELEPVPTPALAAMLDGLRLFGMGFSWAGFESLVIPFDPNKNRTATRFAHEGPLLRFSIGLEDPADLKEDLDAGFARLKAAAG